MTNKSHKGNFEKFSRSRHYKQDKVREMTRKADRTFHHRRRKNMKRDIKKWRTQRVSKIVIMCAKKKEQFLVRLGYGIFSEVITIT